MLVMPAYEATDIPRLREELISSTATVAVEAAVVICLFQMMHISF